MYIIKWSNSPNGVCELTGDWNSILSLADKFENLKIKFKVSSGAGYLSKKIADGNYNYWLSPDEYIS